MPRLSVAYDRILLPILVSLGARFFASELSRGSSRAGHAALTVLVPQARRISAIAGPSPSTLPYPLGSGFRSPWLHIRRRTAGSARRSWESLSRVLCDSRQTREGGFCSGQVGNFPRSRGSDGGRCTTQQIECRASAGVKAPSRKLAGGPSANLTASESAARVIVPSPLAGEGDSAVQQQKWVRVAAATLTEPSLLRVLRCPLPQGERARPSAPRFRQHLNGHSEPLTQ